MKDTKENWKITKRGNDAVINFQATSQDWQSLGEYILKESAKEQPFELGITLHNFFGSFKEVA